MGAVFVKILNMSLTAGWIVLAVLLVRLLFKKKAPKALFPILWAIVAVRLVCPVTVESSFSLIRNAEPFVGEDVSAGSLTPAEAEPPEYPESTDPEEVKKYVEEYENYINYINSLEDAPEEVVVSIVAGPVDTENPDEETYIVDEIKPNETKLSDEIMNELVVHGSYTETTEDGIKNTYTLVQRTKLRNQKTSVYEILSVIWLIGAAGMLLYMGISYLRIYRKVKESAPEEKNIRICDSIDSPFILGLVRPKIYLPSDIDSEDKAFVLAHEKAHLKRFDHLWKPLGFLLLSVYWFHPLLWVAYIVLCKDIEYACDEKVLKALGIEQKKAYSTALINCSVSQKMISACPLAFGENGVKGRVKSVLHYKKPAFWIIIASVVISAVLAVCFLTNPLRKAALPEAGDIITFGTYEQDNVTENGAEPIEWIVLDVFDGKATLLSKYGLDAKAFHVGGEYGAIWSESDLRSWLNSEFYETAFDEEIREQILATRLENYSGEQYKNVFVGDVYTEDKVYLLSIYELFLSFETDRGAGSSEITFLSKASRATATEYARAQGAWEKTYDDGVFSPWLLRTPGLSSHHTARVDTFGAISYDSYNSYAGNVIRPAIRISLADGNFEIVQTTETEEETTQEETDTHSRIGRFVDVVPLNEAKPGYVVKFGRYAKQFYDVVEIYDIEWLVLDVKDGKALLLSKYIMESMPYHEREEEVSWADCTLREWLNGTFYETAFSEEEQARIATTLLENIWNPWNTSAEYEYTEDKVFLPSIEDMLCGEYDYTVTYPETTAYRFDGYFRTDRERMARCTKALTEKTEYSTGLSTARYWLRTSSQLVTKVSKYEFYHDVATIYPDGSFGIGDTLVNDNGGVRPAIWVELGDSDGTNRKDTNQKTESKMEGTSFKASYLPDRYGYKEVKEVFLKYLNHQAYLNPNEYPQEKHTCTVDVYCTADSKMKRVYLKTVNNGKNVWYLCTPTMYLDEEAPLIVSVMDETSVDALLQKDALAYLGADSIKVPAVTKPEYHSVDTEISEYKESINYISELLYKNGYTKKNGIIDGIKVELWISEYDMEKKLLPYAYVIINDSFVYEISFSKHEGLYGSFYTDNYSKDYTLKKTIGENAYIPEEFDGRSIKLLSSMDTKRLERVKECAVLHYVYEEEFSATITVDGKEVTLPKQNVYTDEYSGTAFVPTKTVGNITYYDIYRSNGNGKSWHIVSKDYQTAAGGIAAIVSPMKDYIICYFERSGATESRCILSEDGGVTWSQPVQASKPNAELKDAAVGTTVVFGSYRQDNDWDNGAEDLEWIVLDRVGDKVLLLSKYGIDTNTFYENYHEGDSWETSYMRSWLNNRFFVTTFSKEERSMIATTVNKTPLQDKGYVTTEDRVFLLSSSEVIYGKAQDGTPYFADDVARMLIPTASEVWDCSIDGNNEFEWWVGLNAEWWLRNPGEDEQFVSMVGKDGKITGSKEEYHRYEPAVRPAIWVDISSLAGKGQNSTENVVISPVVGTLTEQIKGLPERYDYDEMKTVLLEYLNHQAWLYPGKYPQEGYTCAYELFCSVADTKTKYVYLKTVINGTERWVEFKPEKYYVATSPTRIVEQRPDIMKESVACGGIVSLGTDELYVPAATKPAYGNPVDITGDISSIYAELKRNGYRENLKLEVIVSEHDLEKNLYPYVYLILNDSEVFETSFGELEGNSMGLYSLSQMFFYGNYSKDYSIEYGDGWPDVFDGHSIKPLDSVDAEQFERVKDCAVFRQIVKGNNTESILIDGETVEIEPSNLGINEAMGVRIAFLPQWAMAGTVHYNIYRSDDRGSSWRMVTDDFSKESGDIARILIPDKDTIVCYFEISGTTSQSSCMVSEDGGVTWKHATYASKPNAFTYDPQKDTSVIFGAYEQDGDYANGKEPLEWIVLDRDGDRALLLAKYGIESLQWDKNQVLEEWEVDDLYLMISRTIYEAAFSAEERAALIRMNLIENASVSYPYERILYPGYTFLLETDDVVYGQGQNETKFFRTEESRITIPTAYAAQKGAWLDENGEFAGVESPWLVTATGTTDGDFSEVEFARVMPDGSISFEEEAIKDRQVLIRPAVWVDVTKLPKPDWMEN